MKQEADRKSVGAEFARYTIFNILGMTGLSCYILADTFFVSRGLGTNGLAALNLALPVYSVVHGCSLMLGMGGATKYAICKGQNDPERMDAVFMNTVYPAVILAVCFVLAGLFASRQITMFLQADAEVAEMTRIYLQMILFFSPVFLSNDILHCFVRNDGEPRLSMMAMLASSFSNIVLDYVFIFPLHMGIFGAVFATGIAPVISLLILSRYLLGKKKGFHFRRVRPEPALIKSEVSLGIPSLVIELSSGVVMVVFNLILLRLAGNVGVAAYGVIANLSLVMTAVYNGLAQGMQPLLGRAYGKGDIQARKQVFTYGLMTVLLLSIIVYVGMYCFADPITAVFNSEKNAKLQKIAAAGIRLYFISVPFTGFNIVVSTYFTSMEKALPAQAISMIRGFLLILPMAYVLSMLAGLTGVWMAVPITEAAVCLLGGTFLLSGRSSRETP